MTDFSIDETGPADAPAVVFLHGYMGSSADFEAVAKPLADRYRCVCVDLPGHGDTPWPDHELSIPDLTDTLRHQVLSRFEAPTLVGYSMGGRIALQTALDHPEAVGNLVLVSTSPGIDDEATREQRRAKDRERAADIRADFAGFLHAWYQLPIFGELSETPGYAAMLERRLQNDPEAMARVVVELSPGRQPSNWHRLGELENARWIVGAQDPKYRALGEKLRGDGHQVVVAEGAAHAVHVECARWLAGVLLEA
jgi:2-succinyl-6-hydroxy-2,4-cyclohexadiene-1-carboxylate synthase